MKNTLKIFSGILVGSFIVGGIMLALAGTITKTYTFSAGTVIESAKVNSNFDQLFTEINGLLDNANFEDGGIATADLADGCVNDTKIASGIANAKISFTTDQTLAGEQTFSDTCNFNDDTVFDSTHVHGLGSYAAPTADAQFAPKKYVDDNIGKDSDLYAIILDQKTANTLGGTFTSGAWRTRDLNTEQFDGIGVSVASNQITVPAGTYHVVANAPANQVGVNQLILYDTTNSDTLVYGQSMQQAPSADDTAVANLTGVFTLAAQAVLELRHRCATTNADDGFGEVVNFGTVEIYAQVFLKKIN